MLLLLIAVLTLSLESVRCFCPKMCECGLDTLGRKVVSCGKGGMTGVIPVKEMDPGIEVIPLVVVTLFCKRELYIFCFVFPSCISFDII